MRVLPLLFRCGNQRIIFAHAIASAILGITAFSNATKSFVIGASARRNACGPRTSLNAVVKDDSPEPQLVWCKISIIRFSRKTNMSTSAS